MNLTISLSAFGRSLTLCLDSDTDSDDTTDRPLSLSRVPVGPYAGLALCDCSAAMRSNSLPSMSAKVVHRNALSSWSASLLTAFLAVDARPVSSNAVACAKASLVG